MLTQLDNYGQHCLSSDLSVEGHKRCKIIRADAHRRPEPMGDKPAVLDPPADCSLRYVERIGDLIDREESLRWGAARLRDTWGTRERNER